MLYAVLIFLLGFLAGAGVALALFGGGRDIPEDDDEFDHEMDSVR